MPASPELLALADQRYVSLVTFRKTGVPVATPVWLARDRDSLIVTTIEGTGKVKRLRNDPRVRLAPSTIRGKVADDATWVDAVATIEPMTPALSSILGTKYGLMYRLNGWMQSRRGSRPESVILRIS